MSQYNSDPAIQFNIKQTAKFLDVVPATIRNWEKAGLFTAKRTANNYRVYTLDDLDILKKIKSLSVDEKIGISTIKNFLFPDFAISHLASELSNSTIPKYSNQLISSKWKESRIKKGLTIDEVSSNLNISDTYLSALEEGHADISLDLLNQLASFYDESILHFFEIDSEDTLVVKKGTGEIAEVGLTGVHIGSLICQKNHILFPMMYTVEPGCGSGAAHHHRGEEFIHVLNGQIEITLNHTEIYILKQGDSMFFNSFHDHSWRNPSEKRTKLIWVHSHVEANV